MCAGCPFYPKSDTTEHSRCTSFSNSGGKTICPISLGADGKSLKTWWYCDPDGYGTDPKSPIQCRKRDIKSDFNSLSIPNVRMLMLVLPVLPLPALLPVLMLPALPLLMPLPLLVLPPPPLLLPLLLPPLLTLLVDPRTGAHHGRREGRRHGTLRVPAHRAVHSFRVVDSFSNPCCSLVK